MSLEMEVINEQTEHTIDQRILDRLDQAMQEASRQLKISDREVVISLVDDRTIQHLNHEYRGIDRPTDVLSFAMDEQGEGELTISKMYDATLPQMLGDIVISVPRALEQAEEYGHSFEREICFLAVHGFLHLMGYDHGSEEDEKEMFALQEKILETAGITRES